MISTRGSCLFGGCMYSLDSLVGVIPMLVFPVCWDVECDDADAWKHAGVLKIYFCHSLGLHSLPYSACKGQYCQA